MARDLLACPECNLEAENFGVALSGENDDDLDYECPGCGALISRGELRRKRIFSIYGGDDDLNEQQTRDIVYQFLRGRFPRDYVQPMVAASADVGIFTGYPSGLVTNGAVSGVPNFPPLWDNGSDNISSLSSRGDPYIVGSVAGGGGAGECCEMVECYNNEPYGFLTNEIDAMWSFYNTVSAVVFTQNVVSTAAGNRFGIEFGNAFGTSNSDGATFQTAQVHFALYYDMFLGKWSLRVNNKWAAVGHKTFTVDLGAQPGGIPAVTASIPFWLELRWYPLQNNKSKVEAWINNRKVYTFTDVQNGGSDTPMKDIYDNRFATGETIKGGGIFVTSITLADQLKVAFHHFHCETWVFGGYAPTS